MDTQSSTQVKNTHLDEGLPLGAEPLGAPGEMEGPAPRPLSWSGCFPLRDSTALTKAQWMRISGPLPRRRRAMPSVCLADTTKS